MRVLVNPGGGGGGGGGTHSGFGYPLQNGLLALWLKARKEGAVTDPRTLRRGGISSWGCSC